MSTVLKDCRGCGSAKPVEEFSLSSSSRDGRQSRCKACKAIYAKANSKKISAASRKWRQENPERYRASNAAYYAKNRETAIARVAQWRIDNTERYRAMNAIAAQRNSAAATARAKAWAGSNPGRARRNKARWRKDNRDKIAELRARRRALQSDPDADRGIAISSLRSRDGDICSYCGCLMDFETKQSEPDKASIDHVVPLRDGGRHSFENTVLACLACNLSKGAKSLSSWLLEMRQLT